MDLWIRSQKGYNLIKVNTIEIIEDEDEHIFLLITDRKRLVNGSEEYILLGEYKTEERALEILDDIQKRIRDLDKRDFLGMTETNYIDNVYNMPKE